MPWVAIPHGGNKVQGLMQKYGIQGIPNLVVLAKDGTVIVDNARNDVTSQGPGVIEQWEEKSSQFFTASFSGEGNVLEQANSSASEPINMNMDGPAYDPAQPTCMINVRFHNGQTKKITMNTESPVSLLHEFLMVAAPVDGSYQLIAGFPPKPIEDPNQTIKQAGLNGGVVTQRLV